MVGPELITYHHRSERLGFEKGKLATNARPRGKAPRMVGIGMSVRNCLAAADIEWTYYWKTQRCKLVKWCQSSNWNQPMGCINISNGLKIWMIGLFNPFSTPMNPNESFGLCEIWHGYGYFNQCWRRSPLVRIGLGWSSMDHQIHHPYLDRLCAASQELERKLLSPIILHSLQCFIVLRNLIQIPLLRYEQRKVPAEVLRVGVQGTRDDVDPQGSTSKMAITSRGDNRSLVDTYLNLTASKPAALTTRNNLKQMDEKWAWCWLKHMIHDCN